MEYYKVKKDVSLSSKEEITEYGLTVVYKSVELVKNELLTEKELQRLCIDKYKDNTNIFDVIVTSSHNTYISFGARFLAED